MEVNFWYFDGEFYGFLKVGYFEREVVGGVLCFFWMVMESGMCVFFNNFNFVKILILIEDCWGLFCVLVLCMYIIKLVGLFYRWWLFWWWDFWVW